MADEARPNIFPVLLYKDATAASEWLKQAFGFEEKATYKDENGQVVHGEFGIGPGIVMFGSAGGDADNPWAQTTHGVYLHVDTVDAHYTQAKAAGAEIVRDLADTDYGAREYSVRDLDGNLWSFGTYGPASGWRMLVQRHQIGHQRVELLLV